MGTLLFLAQVGLFVLVILIASAVSYLDATVFNVEIPRRTMFS